MAEVRRAFLDAPGGQIHLRLALPSTTDFRERPALLCLHHSPSSGWIYERLLKIAGEQRPVLAPDTPGFGESFIPDGPISIEYYADQLEVAISRFAAQGVIVHGYHTGACIATELALRYPEAILKVILDGVPLLDEDERQAFRAMRFPALAREDGTHLTQDWALVQQWAMAELSLGDRARTFAEMLRGGDAAWKAETAVADYPLGRRMAAIRQPVAVLRPRDDLWEITDRARAVLPQAAFIDLPDYGHGMFQIHAADIVGLLERIIGST